MDATKNRRTYIQPIVETINIVGHAALCVGSGPIANESIKGNGSNMF